MMQAIHLGKNINDQCKNFIESQLRPNKVLDQNVLSAFEKIDRESYLPSQYQTLAYADANFAVAPGRVAMSPLILARLLSLVEIKPTDRCLVIGCATGYSVALLGCLSENIVACEEDITLVEQAVSNLKDSQTGVYSLCHGPLNEGAPERAPFDFILIEGGVEIIPSKILDQLNEEGTLVTIHNKNSKMGKGGIWQKNNNVVTSTYVFEAYVPCLPGFAEKKVFSLQWNGKVIKEISPKELDSMIRSGGGCVLIDVRQPWEFNICHLTDSMNIPLGELDKILAQALEGKEIVTICHHGVRSKQAAMFLSQMGYADVVSLRGGVDAWAQEIDPTMERY